MSDEQKIALDKALRRYRSELHALAAERMSLNAVLAQAAVPGKSDSVQKVCSTKSYFHPVKDCHPCPIKCRNRERHGVTDVWCNRQTYGILYQPYMQAWALCCVLFQIVPPCWSFKRWQAEYVAHVRAGPWSDVGSEGQPCKGAFDD